MKKFLIVLFAMILLSGCIAKTVKNGDKISVDYTGSFENGKVFDTSIESAAVENNIIKPEYKPLNFTVGRGEVVRGFDEGVVGMKIGETKTLTIPPEKAYGEIDQRRIQFIPVIQVVPKVFPRVVNISFFEFERSFGKEHRVGEVVTLPGTNISLTIKNISTNVYLSYNFKVGNKLPSNAPWNETVIKVDENNITVDYSVKKNDTIKFQGVPWNTSVVGVSSVNITLRHNPVPETFIPTVSGMVKVSFNETFIKMDRNHELAGKTLIFNVTLKSIEK